MLEQFYAVVPTAWGYMAAVWTERGLWRLGFPRRDRRQALAVCAVDTAAIKERYEDMPLVKQLMQELQMYFQGIPVDFGVPVDWRGYTVFQAAVLRYTAAIPYGETRTYREAAAAAGSPRAARAAGGALHINRAPIVVPCHRVVGANGRLTGFGGGLDMKQALLLLESATE